MLHNPYALVQDGCTSTDILPQSGKEKELGKIHPPFKGLSQKFLFIVQSITPFPYALKFLIYPLSPHIPSYSFSGKNRPFPLCDSMSVLHGNHPIQDLAPLLVFSGLLLFPGALFFVSGVWVIEQSWALGEL